MIKDHQIEVFKVLATTLSYTKAAQKLYIAPQAVSQCILKLEKELGFRLFERTTRHVSLTDSGKAYLDLIQNLSFMYEDQLEGIRKADSEKNHSINFNYGYLSNQFMGAAMMRTVLTIKKEMLGFDPIPINSSVYSLINMLKTGFASFIILPRHMLLYIDYPYNKHLLTDTQYYLMLSMGYAHTEKSTWKDFSSLPLIMDRYGEETDAEFERRQMEECNYWGLAPSRIIETATREDAFHLACRERGTIYDSEFSIYSMSEGLLAYPLKKEPIYAITLPTLYNPLVTRMIRQLKQELNDIRSEKNNTVSRK